MATTRTRKRKRPAPAEKRIDVARSEYRGLLELAQRNSDAIKRLELDLQIQFRRTAEVQAEIDRLKQPGAPEVGTSAVTRRR
jgi:hypothetical protein